MDKRSVVFDAKFFFFLFLLFGSSFTFGLKLFIVLLVFEITDIVVSHSIHSLIMLLCESQ